MDFLQVTASLTRRIPIVNTTIADYFPLPALNFGDSMSGTIFVVSETQDPTAPTTPVPLDSSTGIAITDGASTIWAVAIQTGIQNTNEIHFTLTIAGGPLLAAIQAANSGANPVQFLNTYLEVRAKSGGQDSVILREPLTILAAATGAGATAVTPAAVPGIIFNWIITGLTGAGTTLANVPTVGLAQFTIIAFTISGSAQLWQLVAGAATGLGQVAPADYNASLNNVHWLKVL